MGRHRTQLSRRGRAVLAGLTLAVVAAAAIVSVAVVQRAARGDDLIRTVDVCATPPPLRRSRGVRLQPEAMRAFKRAERLAGHSIEVVQSYRSCADQAEACRRICQNPGGCPGLCAPPGASYHQLGAAIDVSERMLSDQSAMEALRRAGWCQSVPDSDPGHFSFGGCH